MRKEQIAIIKEAIEIVKERFETDTTGHDFNHMMRTFSNARYLQEKEGGDLFIILVAALFHDLPDHKLTSNPEAEYARIRNWLEEKGVAKTDIDHILHCIRSVSYRGGKNPYQPQTIEAKIVQDADRLDALGAIGIARAFAYGGSKNRKMYDLEEENAPTTVQHFYDKLLLLKDLMQTETGRKIAEERTEFMQTFLKQLKKEISVPQDHFPFPSSMHD